MTIAVGLTALGLGGGENAVETTTAADRGGGSAASATGALNPPPGAPLDRDAAADRAATDAAQPIPSPTAASTSAANASSEDPKPASTDEPSSSTANSAAVEPTATKQPATATAAPTATSPAATPTKVPPTPAPSPTAAATQAPTQPLATPTATQPPAPTATPVTPTATPTSPPPPQSIALHSMEAAMFGSHNLQRANNGVAPLAIDAQLVDLARQRSQTMANTNCFSHTACGPTAFDLLGGIGYVYQIAGENIARNNYPDSETVTVAMNGFMNSTGHRANILETSYTRVGIGVAFGANDMKYFTVIFTGL